MKKSLLSLIVMLATLSASAHDVGEYIHTSAGKFYVDEVLEVPAFGDEWNNWGADKFSPFEAQVAGDYDGIQSVSSDEGSFISTAVEIEDKATYLISFHYMFNEAGSSSILEGALNRLDAWESWGDDMGERKGVAGIDYSQVATTFTYKANEWTEVSWVLTDTMSNDMGEQKYLNILFSRVNEGAVIAKDFRIIKVTQVYDTDIMQKEIDYIKTLIATAEALASDEYEELMLSIEFMEETIAAEDGTFDTESDAIEALEGLWASADAFLSIEAPSLNEQLEYIDFATYQQKVQTQNISFGAISLEGGGRWRHAADNDPIIYTSIQK